jgi:hypothetical protein
MTASAAATGAANPPGTTTNNRANNNAANLRFLLFIDPHTPFLAWIFDWKTTWVGWMAQQNKNKALSSAYKFYLISL